jgi:hypothetical protein
MGTSEVMNQATLSDAAGTAVQKSKSFIAGQIERQAHTLGTTISQTAHDLEAVGSHLRQTDTISGAAPVADWAARYVAVAGTYLQSGDTDRFLTDLETFGRQRPWAVAASTAVLGFVAARVIKSSSARRYQRGDYGDASDGFRSGPQFTVPMR